MISYMDCPAARERLESFVDGELEVTEQVALEWHLRWCRVCSARVSDLQLIGAGMRWSGVHASSPGEGARSAFVQDAVLAHVRAEREGAWLTRLGCAARDRRLLWPALGATSAVLVCMVAMGAVLRAATYETPDSLAGMIAVLANPGSDANPVRLDGRISMPRALAQERIVDAIPDEDMMLALAAVVTREGRVANYELLESTRDRVRRRQAAAWTDDLDAVLDAVGRTRFTPAQGVSGDPVAVSLVWLLTRTTVFSSTEALQGVEPAAVAPVLPPPAVVAVPVEEAPALVVPVIDLDITPEPGVGVLPAAQSGIA
jgi:hypothetical protein